MCFYYYKFSKIKKNSLLVSNLINILLIDLIQKLFILIYQ